MAGLVHLRDLYTSKGLKFIEDLFSSSAYITEKIDGSRFAFEKTNNELEYFKRDGKTPINMVDRTVMKYYESAIAHIESLSLSSIPSGIRFGFEYFANNNPGSIVYDKIPQNGLILTDISKGSTLDTNIDTLSKYAKQLKVSPPPVIHNGSLNKTQKEQLTDFLTTEWDDLIKKFKTESFTTYIISILNPKLKNTALNIGTAKPIEGIVFSFDKGDTFVNTKVVDPLYTEKAREMARNRHTPEKKESNLQIKEVLRDILKFSKSIPTTDIKFKSKSKEVRYIEVLSYIFKQYYLENKSKFSKIPTDTKSDDIVELDINYNFIFDVELKKILKSNKKVKILFKSFLAAFGKTRKRGTVVIDKNMLSSINSLIPKFHKVSEARYTPSDYSISILSEIVKKTII